MMEISNIIDYLDSVRCHNAYVLVAMGDEYSHIEIGIARARVWLDEQNYDGGVSIHAQIVHGGTAILLGGTDR